MSEDPPGTDVPWAPEALPVQFNNLHSYRYIVVEEIVDETVLVRSWRWPVVDQRGRLVWPGESEQQMHAFTIDRNVLRAQLYLNNGLRRRPRVGDVFAVEGVSNQADGTRDRWHVDDLREVIEGAAYDVSADAREAAKIAYSASLTAIARPYEEDEALQAAVTRTVRARAGNPLPRLEIAAPSEASP